MRGGERGGDSAVKRAEGDNRMGGAGGGGEELPTNYWIGIREGRVRPTGVVGGR